MQVILVRRVEPVSYRFDVAADHRKRRAKLVGDIGQEIAPALLVRLEAFGHPVERRSEPANVTPATGLDPRLIIAGRDAVRGVHHVCQRHREPAVGAHGDDQEQNDEDRGHEA